MLLSSSSHLKELYNPRAFFTHAAWLDQGCPHCPIFPTAASRRSLGRVSVPVWLIILSDQLLIVALVGFYPTNKLIRRGPLFQRLTFPPEGVYGISSRFQLLSPSQRQVPKHYSPVRHSSSSSKLEMLPFDLHVLGLPPAFNLSHDQTLQLNISKYESSL